MLLVEGHACQEVHWVSGVSEIVVDLLSWCLPKAFTAAFAGCVMRNSSASLLSVTLPSVLYKDWTKG